MDKTLEATVKVRNQLYFLTCQHGAIIIRYAVAMPHTASNIKSKRTSNGPNCTCLQPRRNIGIHVHSNRFLVVIAPPQTKTTKIAISPRDPLRARRPFPPNPRPKTPTQRTRLRPSPASLQRASPRAARPGAGAQAQPRAPGPWLRVTEPNL